MADYVHRDVIITYYADEDVDKSITTWLESFRKDLDKENMAQLLLGPIAIGNGMFRVFLSSSGSGEGWPVNRRHLEFCRELLEHFKYRAVMVENSDLVGLSVVSG
jgi:hypothetical protein